MDSSGSHTRLAVVIPTFNEKDSIVHVFEQITSALKGFSWELIFVDDNSPDGTAEAIRALARDHSHVRLIKRVNTRGLSSASILGMFSNLADYVIVMDADSQHDVSILPKMVAALEQNTDVVVASRFLDGGGRSGLSTVRYLGSRLFTMLSKFAARREVSDPLSGYFAVRRSVIEAYATRLMGIGFKILLDILSIIPKTSRIAEVPFTFGHRSHGDSKMSSQVVWDLLCFIIARRIFFSIVPVTLVSFVGVGLIGAVVHMAVFVGTLQLGVDFVPSHVSAVVCAAVFNFYLNNKITYRHASLSGGRFVVGLLVYGVLTAVGLVANVGTAVLLHTHGSLTTLVCSAAGMVVDTIWRYAISSQIIWRVR